ncbi:hypothetical protein N9S30_00580 [bacterium]|nr:hypothetical protein [bacterium]
MQTLYVNITPQPATTTTTMSRRNQRRMPVATLDQTIEAMMAHFFELIDNGALADQRNHIFKALLLLRRVSKQVGVVLTRDMRTRYYLFFAASSLKERGPARFLDGAFSVDMFNGAVGTGPRNPARFARVTPLQCLSDRLKSAKKLAEMSEVVLHSRSGAYYPSDVPSSVHMRVGMLVGRARYMVQRCRQLHATTQCSHCGSTFFTFDTPTATGAAFEEIDGESSEDDDDATGGPPAPCYWDSVALTPLDLDPVRVCSMACHLAAKQLMQNGLPESFELKPKKLGFVGVAETARLCLKRNTAYERQLRMTRKRVHTAKESALMRRCVEMLCIDTALCLCAARTAEVRMLREAAMVLPGELEAWRDGRGIFIKQLERIKSIYREHGGATSGKLVTDEHRPPKWLGKCLETASWLFEGTKR